MSQAKLLDLKKEVAPFEKTNIKTSVWQMMNTFVPLFVLWYLAYLSLEISYFLTLPIVILAGGFLVRSFIIFHDCCHQSFFKSKLANDIVGNIIAVLTIIPYQQWKNEHSIHHASSGNLDKRGIGDIWLMTIDEYKSASKWMKLAYRVYRNPLVMFLIGPIFVFMLQYRFNSKRARRKERINTYLNNIYIAILYTALCWLLGWQTVLMIQGPIFMISGSLGIWLFYVQHQFEDSYFEKNDEWSYVKAAVEGSSYYKLPRLLQWLTGNIGFHHVHHFSPKVPNYHLEKAHNEATPLQKAETITLLTSLKSLRFRLWDEENKYFVNFKDLRQKQTVFESTSRSPMKRKAGLQGE